MTTSLYPVDALEISRQNGIPIPENLLRQLSECVEELPAAVELLALRWHIWQERSVDILEQLPILASQPLIEDLCSSASSLGLTQLRTPGRTEPPRQVSLEASLVVEIPPTEFGWQSGDPFMVAQEQFAGTLTRAGMDRQFALALTAAFDELASNAAEHAMAPVPALGGRWVGDQSWSFSVTDVGQGVRASLRQNKEFADLQSDTHALQEAMKEGISRHGRTDRGLGFGNVFKALVDRRVMLRFRSGGAVGSWSGSSPTAQQVSLTSLPLTRAAGFHVCLSGPLP